MNKTTDNKNQFIKHMREQGLDTTIRADERKNTIKEFREALNKELHCAFSDDLEIQKHVDKIAEQMLSQTKER